MILELSGKYVFAPVEVFQDRELNLIDLRVLLALYSFRNGDSDRVWPSRKTIAERCGYTPTTISRSVTKLVCQGWVQVKQRRGPNIYILKLPETVGSSETVSDPKTVADPARNSDRSGHQTVTDPATPELTKELTIDLFSRNNEVCGEDETPETYMTKKKRELQGQQLEWFGKFWIAFNFKQGKAEAADAWLDLNVTKELLSEILDGAKLAANGRTKPGEKGPLPKMAQGWLSGRRWEDEMPATTEHSGGGSFDQTLPLGEYY